MSPAALLAVSALHSQHAASAPKPMAGAGAGAGAGAASGEVSSRESVSVIARLAGQLVYTAKVGAPTTGGAAAANGAAGGAAAASSMSMLVGLKGRATGTHVTSNTAAQAHAPAPAASASASALGNGVRGGADPGIRPTVRSSLALRSAVLEARRKSAAGGDEQNKATAAAAAATAQLDEPAGAAAPKTASGNGTASSGRDTAQLTGISGNQATTSSRPTSASTQAASSSMGRTSSFSNAKASGHQHHQHHQHQHHRVTVTVFDDSKDETRKFSCSLPLLLRHMKYFKSYVKVPPDYTSHHHSASNDVEIVVQCDISVFSWLLQYVKSHNDDDANTADVAVRPQLTLGNSVSVLIASNFLKMDALVAEAVSFIAKHIIEVIRLPTDLACLSDDILALLSDRLSVDTIEVLRRSDDGAGAAETEKKETNHKGGTTRSAFVARLYRAKVDRMLIRCDGAGLDASAPGQIADAAGGIAGGMGINCCARCGKLFPRGAAGRKLACPAARPLVGFDGTVVMRHSAVVGWRANVLARSLHEQMGYTWREVFWRLWAALHIAGPCGACGQFFTLNELAHCAYHPAPARFDAGSASGCYPCCGAHARRFDAAPTASLHGALAFGCKAREHVITDAKASSAVAAPREGEVLVEDAEDSATILALARRHAHLVQTPFAPGDANEGKVAADDILEMGKPPRSDVGAEEDETVDESIRRGRRARGARPLSARATPSRAQAPSDLVIAEKIVSDASSDFESENSSSEDDAGIGASRAEHAHEMRHGLNGKLASSTGAKAAPSRRKRDARREFWFECPPNLRKAYRMELRREDDADRMHALVESLAAQRIDAIGRRTSEMPASSAPPRRRASGASAPAPVRGARPSNATAGRATGSFGRAGTTKPAPYAGMQDGGFAGSLRSGGGTSSARRSFRGAPSQSPRTSSSVSRPTSAKR